MFRVGLALAEVAATRSEELLVRSNRDDYFITGFLRERLPWVQMRQLEVGISGLVWENLLSQCTWLAVTKNIFFNQFVVSKSSGSVSYVQVREEESFSKVPPSCPRAGGCTAASSGSSTSWGRPSGPSPPPRRPG